MKASYSEGKIAFPIHLAGLGRITLSDARELLETLPEAIRQAESADKLGLAREKARAAGAEMAAAIVKHMDMVQRGRIVETMKFSVVANLLEEFGLINNDSVDIQRAFVEGWDSITHPT